MPFGCLPRYTTTSESTPQHPPVVKGVLHPAFVLTKSNISKGQSLPQNSLGVFQGFHLLFFFFFFNKANKEKYYFALLIFFFLLCVYVRAFERAVGYVAQTGPLAALLGFMVLSHRSTGLRPWLGGYRCLWRPEVGVGWVPSSVTVEAEVGVGWVSSFVTVHLLWRQGPSWNLASADSHELLVSKLWDPPVPPELRF